MAVVLSDITRKCLMLRCNDENALTGNFMAKSSKQFMGKIFSVSDHFPLIL